MTVPHTIPPTCNVPLHDVRDGMRRFYEAWLEASAARGGALPRRGAMRPDRFREALGNVIVLEPVDGGRDFRFRLYGTSVSQGHGADMTGKRVSDLPPTSVPIVMPLYRRVMTEGRPLFSRLETGSAVVVRIWDRLILPLAEDGERVDQLMVAMYPVAYRRDPDRIYPGGMAAVKVAL